MKRRILWGLAALILVLFAYTGIRMTARSPGWHDGDLIFQTSHSTQSTAILAATHSAFTHMGILEKRDTGWVVLEAAGPVKAPPLKTWIKRGRAGRYAVYRRPLDAQQTRRILKATHDLMGRPYDLFFSFDNRAIYCSELPYLAYRKAGIDIGQVQTVSELHVDGPRVRKLIESRWQRHAICDGLDFDHCYAKIMAQPLVTPVSIARDRQFRQVYSNYPF